VNYDEFLGKEVKCCFRDGGKFKIAVGILKEHDSENRLIKIVGNLGPIIVGEKTIEKLGLKSKKKQDEGFNYD